MSTGSPAHSFLTRPLSVHPVRPRLHSAISNGSLFAGYMYARVPQAMAQFVLKIETLSHIMGPSPILEMARAYGLRPRLWLLVKFLTLFTGADPKAGTGRASIKPGTWNIPEHPGTSNIIIMRKICKINFSAIK